MSFIFQEASQKIKKFFVDQTVHSFFSKSTLNYTIDSAKNGVLFYVSPNHTSQIESLVCALFAVYYDALKLRVD